jgi:hypothetical protein
MLAPCEDIHRVKLISTVDSASMASPFSSFDCKPSERQSRDPVLGPEFHPQMSSAFSRCTVKPIDSHKHQEARTNF